MAFFDGLNKRLNEVKESAQKTAELARIQRRINSMQQEVDKVYHQIGKAYYTNLRANEGNMDALVQMCAMIDSLEKDIDALSHQTDEIRQVKRCANCDAVQGMDSQFCATCGSKLQEIVPPVIQAEVVEEESAEPEPIPAEPEPEPVETSGSVSINWPESGQNDAVEPEEDQ